MISSGSTTICDRISNHRNWSKFLAGLNQQTGDVVPMSRLNRITEIVGVSFSNKRRGAGTWMTRYICLWHLSKMDSDGYIHTRSHAEFNRVWYDDFTRFHRNSFRSFERKRCRCWFIYRRFFTLCECFCQLNSDYLSFICIELIWEFQRHIIAAKRNFHNLTDGVSCQIGSRWQVVRFNFLNGCAPCRNHFLVTLCRQYQWCRHQYCKND